MSMMTSAAPPAGSRDVKSWRLLALMTGAGAVAGLLIAASYEATLPRIERHKGEVVRATVQEVLKGPALFDTLYLVNGALTKVLPAGTSAKGLETVYLGRDANGGRLGFAVSATENGFQDPVTVMFGYDPAARTVIAMKVIANKETPGLGDKIVKDSTFVKDFEQAVTPLEGVKKGAATTRANDIVMITGATISSRAVIRIINNAIARWQPLMDAYSEGARP
jgi:Na+-translocating ferredoxin:NAD+ oxidoreductase subunit G